MVESDTFTPKVSKETLGRIDGFADLTEDWDSYGAPPIAPSAIEATKRVLTILSEVKVQTAPTCQGGISIEWHGPSGDLELEIMPDGETIEGLVAWRFGDAR